MRQRAKAENLTLIYFETHFVFAGIKHFNNLMISTGGAYRLKHVC